MKIAPVCWRHLRALLHGLERSALAHLVDDIPQLFYLHRVVIDLDRATEDLYPEAVCQVEMAEGCDPKHQEMSADDAEAEMNGIALDRHREERLIELLAENMMRAGQVFLDISFESPFSPDWSQVNAADPDFIDSMQTALELDKALL